MIFAAALGSKPAHETLDSVIQGTASVELQEIVSIFIFMKLYL